MNFSLLKKMFFFLILLFSANFSFGQNTILSESAKVSIITCGTGNESYSMFGHTAIRIADASNNIDMVYNYGAFDFSTPNFVLKFIKGDLQYFAVAHSFTDFISEYNYERRSVYEQELDIPYNFKQKLFDNLNTSLASGESHYTYKFIDKNCTSMVVDMINKTLDTVAIVKKTDTEITYRTILFPYFDNHFYEKLGTSVIFGTKVDALGTHIFLPYELQKSLKKVRFGNRLLANENKVLIEFSPEATFSWWNNCYSYLIVLAIVILWNKKSVAAFYLTVMGILGIFFIWVGFYSLHKELEFNYNVLLFNPTLISLLYFYQIKNRKWLYNLAVFNLTCLAAYVVVLFNKVHLLIVLPLIITSAILLVRIAIQNSKRIPIII